jgi:hypothetical protein
VIVGVFVYVRHKMSPQQLQRALFCVTITPPPQVAAVKNCQEHHHVTLKWTCKEKSENKLLFTQPILNQYRANVKPRSIGKLFTILTSSSIYRKQCDE